MCVVRGRSGFDICVVMRAGAGPGQRVFPPQSAARGKRRVWEHSISVLGDRTFPGPAQNTLPSHLTSRTRRASVAEIIATSVRRVLSNFWFGVIEEKSGMFGV